jgi:two-component system nitrogen regulation sensor histidine kinase GlnL
LNRFYQQVLESIDFGVLVFDREGRLAYLNPAAEELLSGSAQSLTGRHYRAVFAGSPVAARILRKALEEGNAVTAFDAELLPHSAPRLGTAAAAPLPVIVSASPLAGERGDDPGAVLSIKSAEFMSQAGQEERAAVSAEETQMLAYGIAHEIKNPLGGILGAAQWILRHGTTDEEREEGIRLILREAGRINGLIEKMLEMGRTPPPPRPVSLLPLIRDAQELLEAEARALGKRIRFDLKVDPSVPDVSGHGDTIYRALLNVLKNAVEAIETEGSVRVEARMNVNYRLSRGAGRKRSFLDVLVTDSGVGMSEDDIRKSVLPFYTTKPKGTGLGLVMVRQAISRHGGKLAIRSVRGQGTTVTISLPVDTGKKRKGTP